MTEDPKQNPDSATTLRVLREKIDDLDSRIGQLISERASCAQEVGRVKIREGQQGSLKPDSPKQKNKQVFYRPEREAQVLRAAMARNKGPLKDEEFARLFREIMSACLALENPVKVAYLGPEGTYTQEAAVKHFGHSAEVMPLVAIDEIFREVSAGSVHYGVVPVENSTGGVVTHTLDNFITSSVKVCGEVVMRIHHNLLVSDVTKVESISRVYSHAQSLAQCRKWLDLNYPSVERVAVNSNAEAAKKIKGEWNSAAIAGEIASEIYALRILNQNIEDQPDNSTRFLIIGSENVEPSGEDKTSILVSTRNEPGALHDLLAPFHNNGIDLTRVETRPSLSGTWNYVFFIDFLGHVKDAKIEKTLKTISANSSEFKILGSYPKGVL